MGAAGLLRGGAGRRVGGEEAGGRLRGLVNSHDSGADWPPFVSQAVSFVTRSAAVGAWAGHWSRETSPGNDTRAYAPARAVLHFCSCMQAPKHVHVVNMHARDLALDKRSSPKD